MESMKTFYVWCEWMSLENGMPLRGPNNWPDEAALGLTAFRQPMEKYYDAACCLARRLMPSFEAALGLETGFFADKFSHPTALLRPLKYAAAARQEREQTRQYRSISFILFAHPSGAWAQHRRSRLSTTSIKYRINDSVNSMKKTHSLTRRRS